MASARPHLVAPCGPDGLSRILRGVSMASARPHLVAPGCFLGGTQYLARKFQWPLRGHTSLRQLPPYPLAPERLVEPFFHPPRLFGRINNPIPLWQIARFCPNSLPVPDFGVFPPLPGFS